MNEEKKYSVVGQVTIGTDEYRDLIESLAEAKADYSEASRKSTDRYFEIEKLKKEIESLKQYRDFVTEQKYTDSFKLWKLEREQDDE